MTDNYVLYTIIDDESKKVLEKTTNIIKLKKIVQYWQTEGRKVRVNAKIRDDRK